MDIVIPKKNLISIDTLRWNDQGVVAREIDLSVSKGKIRLSFYSVDDNEDKHRNFDLHADLAIGAYGTVSIIGRELISNVKFSFKYSIMKSKIDTTIGNKIKTITKIDGIEDAIIPIIRLIISSIPEV